MKTIFARWLCAVLLAGGASGVAQAQADGFPNRALKILVTIGPGSGADMMCRTLGEQLSQQFGQPVVVENRTGADGIVAAQALLAAPADGYTMMMVSAGTIIINTIVNQPAPYRTSDFRLLTGAARVAGLVAVAGTSRYATLAELSAAARKQPGQVTFGTYGIIYRVAAQVLEPKLDAKFNHVAYKGFGPTTTDLVGGAIESGLIDAGASAPMVRAGKLRGLAVSSKERLAQLPDVPTLRELGITEYDPPIWVGMAVRAGTPEPIALKLEAALMQAMKSAPWRDLLAKQGNLENWPIDGREFDRAVVADTAFFTKALAGGSQ